MKNIDATTLGIRISKEEKEVLQNEADDREMILSDFIKEIIDNRITEKVDDSSPGKNNPGKNNPGKNSPGEQDPENKEAKEYDNLLETAILFEESKEKEKEKRESQERESQERESKKKEIEKRESQERELKKKKFEFILFDKEKTYGGNPLDIITYPDEEESEEE